MKAVIEFTCCRGFPVPVPVAGSQADRDMEIVAVPVPAGSKEGSPAGTATGMASRGAAPVVRPMS